jgi:hypothetical protein
MDVTPELLATHLDRLATTLSPEQTVLLKFLVKGRDVTTSSHDKLVDFYTEQAREGLNAEQAKTGLAQLVDRGRKAVSVLRRALDEAYRTPANCADGFRITIPKGRGKGYRPVFEPLGPGGQESPYVSQEFAFVGFSNEAMAYVTERVPRAKRIEDTAIRWNVSHSHYRSEVMEQFRDALRDNKVRFAAITSPVPDHAYTDALIDAFASEPARLEWFQLRHPAPIMNFMILKYDDGSQEVLFGYGTQRDDQSESETAVFRSGHRQLVKEFQRLFKVLSSPTFAERLTPREVPVRRTHEFDVLESFQDLPTAEICRRIKGSRLVRICSITWPVDQFLPSLTEALHQEAAVDIGLWDSKSAYVQARSRETLGDETLLAQVIANEDALLRSLMAHGPIGLHVCTGQPSVSLYWVDQFIYFSAYWHASGLGGPHFLVRDSSPTGEFLRSQFYSMVPGARRV